MVAKITGMLIEGQTQIHLEKLITDQKYLTDMALTARTLMTQTKQN